MTTHKATCQCGALKVTLDGDPDFVIACNCKACQRRTGAPFGTAGYFRKTAMSVEGQTNTWGRTADSGRALENFFCPTCGTGLGTHSPARPGAMIIKVGTLDDPSQFKAQAAIFTIDKQPYHVLPDDVPAFERRPG